MMEPVQNDCPAPNGCSEAPVSKGCTEGPAAKACTDGPVAKDCTDGPEVKDCAEAPDCMEGPALNDDPAGENKSQRLTSEFSIKVSKRSGEVLLPLCDVDETGGNHW